MKMKKTMALAAVVLLVLSLTACGGAGKQSAASNSPPTKQESPADLFSKGKNLPGLTYDYVMTTKEGPA
jgi:outer membrane lipoprotein-sorting protein